MQPPLLFPPIIPHRIYAHFLGDRASTNDLHSKTYLFLKTYLLSSSRIVHASDACYQSKSSKFQVSRDFILCQAATPFQAHTSDPSSSVDADESLECWQISATFEAPETRKQRRRPEKRLNFKPPSLSRRATNGDAACVQSSMMR